MPAFDIMKHESAKTTNNIDNKNVSLNPILQPKNVSPVMCLATSIVLAIISEGGIFGQDNVDFFENWSLNTGD